MTTVPELMSVLTGLARTAGDAPWPLIAAAVVAAGLALVVAVRAGRGAVRSARRMTLVQVRARAVLVLGTAGMLTAAYGTVRALLAMGQPLPFALTTSAAIEGGAIALAADLYIRVREKRPAGRPRIASWAFALASAWANATNPPAHASWTGALLFGLVPLLGLYMFEYQAHAERPAVKDGAAGWPVRVARATWRRAWTALATWLGVDVNATDTDTERELAARRAARATYRLRLAQLEHAAKPSGRTERRLRRRNRTAQAARERAGVATDPVQALRLATLMRELVHGPEQAAADWHDVAASASRVYGGLLLPGAGGAVMDLSGRGWHPLNGSGVNQEVNLGSAEVNRRGGVVDLADGSTSGARPLHASSSRGSTSIAGPTAQRAIAGRAGSTSNGSTRRGSTGTRSTATVTALPDVNPDAMDEAFSTALDEGRLASLGELAAAGGVTKQAASKRRRRLLAALDHQALTDTQRAAVEGVL